MRGCRPLTDEEITLMKGSFSGKYAERDRALFMLGCYSGFRVSELLSLKVGDVVEYGGIVSQVTVQRRNMKGSGSGRSVALNPKAREALMRWLVELGEVSCSAPLFPSRKGDRPISRVQAHRILKEAAAVNQIGGKVSTHSMRKSFAQRVHKAVDGDLMKTQRALGHKSINSTVQYLSFDQQDVDDAVLAI